MKPFAILTIWYFLKFFKIRDNYINKKISIYEWFCFAGLMFITTAFKPNFILGFSLSLLIVLIKDFVKTKGKNLLNFVFIGTTVFPSVLLTLYQNIILFDNDSEVLIGYMVGLRALTNSSDLKICLRLALSLLFPIMIFIISHKDIIKDKCCSFGWLYIIVNLFVTIFIYESGDRISHGNFIWGSNFASGILFISSIKWYIQIPSIYKKAVASFILFFNIICGFIYLFLALNGYLMF